MEIPSEDDSDEIEVCTVDTETLYIPGMPLIHEPTIDCWCEPDYIEYEDESVDILHNFPIH